MTGPFNPGAGRAISLGEALAMGLAQGTTGFIQTNNTFEQQRQQQANILADQQYRAQQAEEQRRQFDAQQRQARDSQAFQWLNGQQQQLTQILAKGGYAKGSPEYQAAETALKETNKLMGKVIKGGELTPEEQQSYDTLLGNVAAITGLGAAQLGERAAALDDASLNATTTQTAAVAGQTRRADELQPFGVAQAGLQNRLLGVQANVAEGTQGDLIARTGLENQGLALRNEGQGLQNTAQGQQNVEFAATSPYRVQSAESGARIGAVQATVAENTQSAQERTINAQADAAEIGVETGRWQLEDLKTKAPLVYEGLRLSNAGAQQALDFNAEVQPEKMVALRQQNEQTRQQINQSGELFPWQKRALTAQVNVQEAQAEIVQATKAGTISRTNAESWATLAREVRDPAAFDQLVKDGVMTPAQAAPFKALAGYYRDSAGAALDQARATARTATSQANVAERTENATVRTAEAQADTAETGAEAAVFNLDSARQLFPVQLQSAQTALATAQQALSEARAGQPYRVGILRAQLATLKQELSQNAALFGPKLAQAQGVVRQLESEIRVLESSEEARISAAQSGAQTAAADAAVAGGTVDSRVALSGAQAAAAQAGATSAQAQAQVDVATIPAQIAARNLAPQAAQAALNAQLLENRFADATFKDRVRAVNVNTSQGVQQLLALKQQYRQNAQKFPAELAYLNAQIAVQEANAKAVAAESLSADGAGVTDKKSMLAALDSMRKINADERRLASTNLQNTVKRLIPNARFSVDKYDAKSFMAMVGSASNLTPDQRQELQNAQLAFDAASAKAADLSTAIGQIAGKGRIDPNVAERLGILTPEEAGGDGVSTLTAQILTPGTDLRKLGFTADALNNTKNADGSWTSYCTRLARQYTELRAGAKPFSLGAYFKGSATETHAAFEKQNALFTNRVSPDAALQNAGSLKEGDLIFLNYGNPKIDHVAVYDGKGGIIQHSLPGFRGQTIQGAVNTMSLEQFLGKAGRATVSFARVGGARQGPAAPAGARPSAPAQAAKPAPAQAAKPKPLTMQAAKPLIQKAASPAELEGIQAQLVAAGMSANQAVAYIRDVKQGRK